MRRKALVVVAAAAAAASARMRVFHASWHSSGSESLGAWKIWMS
jgi:type IV secretory pathway protease TraF